MEFTWEFINKYTYKATTKESKMNKYDRMKLQDYIDGLVGPAGAIFDLETDDFTRPYQISFLKQLKKRCKLTAEQEKIFDEFIEENSKPRRKPLFWAWTFKIYEGKKMMIGKNEYCGYLHSYTTKQEREEECNFTKDVKVGPLTITLKTEPITAATAYKALLTGNGVPEEFLRRQYLLEDQEGRDLTLQELLMLWRSTCTDLIF